MYLCRNTNFNNNDKLKNEKDNPFCSLRSVLSERSS